MKQIILGMALLSSISVFANEISYTNLPIATTNVTTLGGAYSDKTLASHKQDQQSALEDLKSHVVNQLNRQVIEAKCGEVKTVIYSSKQGLKSTCTVSFL